MLKIKDNVDLKELEKFGFEELHHFYQKNTNNGMWYFITKENRIIEICTYDDDEIGLDDILYDLIKADMVEKI